MIKMCVNLLKDKKAEGQDVIFPIVIFLVLNLVFFGILLLYIFKASIGALVYEQAYAKQIALVIDSVKPVSQLSLDFTKAIEIAESN